jgi:hypothetical protein
MRSSLVLLFEMLCACEGAGVAERDGGIAVDAWQAENDAGRVGTDASALDAGRVRDAQVDAFVRLDASIPDSGARDASEALDATFDASEASDAGDPDAGEPDAGVELFDAGPGVCGDGITNVVSGEACDDAGPTALCSGQCEIVSTRACVDCELAGDCYESIDNCVHPDFSPENTELCYDVMECIQESDCFDGDTLGNCYCGSMTLGECIAAPFDGDGAPDGACRALIQAGFLGRADTNSEVLGMLTYTRAPSGAAMQRLNCQDYANDHACREVCGHLPGGIDIP